MRTVVAALVGAAVAMAPVPAPAAPRRSPPCYDLAFSPDFARDRTVFCVYDVSTVATYLARSTDGGRSWGPGRVVTTGDARFFGTEAAVSPWFPTDGRVLVSTYGVGLFESTDRGTTFRRVGDGADPRDTPSAQRVAPFLDPAPDPTGPRRAFAYATGRGAPRVYDTGAGPREVVGAPADVAVRFLVPPDYPQRREAVLLAAPPVALYQSGSPVVGAGLGAYTCVGDFVCPRRHFSFGDVAYRYSAPLGAAGSYVLVTQDRHGPKTYVWRTRDHGRTWQQWPAVERLLAARRSAVGHEVVVTAHPSAPRRLFLHLSSWNAGDDPYFIDEDSQRFELYRSDDDGVGWRRVGASAASGGGTLPWNIRQEFKPVTLAAQSGGRLYATGAHRTRGRVGYQGMYCSANLGRTWRRGAC